MSEMSHTRQERSRATKSTPEEISEATADIENMNTVIRMLNGMYIGNAECDGGMAWACVSCRAVNLRTQLRSFAHELADLYGVNDAIVDPNPEFNKAMRKSK